MELTFAIIGAGAVADTRYIPALQNNSISTISWIIDIDESRAERVATDWTVPNFDVNYEPALREIDAAIITTPPRTHASIIRDCLNNGVHVLTEKPIALSSADGMELFELAKLKNLQLDISRQYRESPSLKVLKEMYTADCIPEIDSIALSFGDMTEWNFASNYRVTKQLAGGGVLMDKGPHMLDIIYWLCDRQLELKSYQDDNLGGLEANAFIEFSVPQLNIDCSLELSGTRNLSNTIALNGSNVHIETKPDTSIVKLRGSSFTEDIFITSNALSDPPTASDRMAQQVNKFVSKVISDQYAYDKISNAINILDFINECYANRKPLDRSWEKTQTKLVQ